MHYVYSFTTVLSKSQIVIYNICTNTFIFSINIYAFYKAQKLNKEINLSCAIGDEIIDGKPYEEIVKEAKAYIDKIGGFEKLAEWGLY